MMKKVILPLLCLALLAGCEKNTTESQSVVPTSIAASQEQAGGISYKVISYPYTPFVIRGDNGEISSGLETEILQAIAEKQKIHFEFIPPMTSWETLFDTMKSKKADLLSAGMYPNEERHQHFDISKPYMDTRFALLSKKGTRINGLIDLKNKKVALMPKSIAEEEISHLPYANTIDIIHIKSIYDGVSSVLSGRADVLYGDQVVLTYYANQFKNKNLVVSVDPNAETHQFVFLITKGNINLLNHINQGLAEIQADGTLDQIKNKWLKE